MKASTTPMMIEQAAWVLTKGAVTGVARRKAKIADEAQMATPAKIEAVFARCIF
jgi:hypothetical protein